MSRSAWIDISVTTQLDILKLIQSFLDNNWSYDDCGRITYLPFNDGDRFGWKSVSFSEYLTVIEVIKAKIKNSEIVGIVLTWKDTGIGGDFLFFEENQLSMSLSCNRRTIKNYNDISDVSWYIERIAIPIIKAGYVIECVNWKEII